MVVVGAEVVGEGSAGQAIYHQWVLHLLIYKICPERLLLCIPCVIGHSLLPNRLIDKIIVAA